MKTCKFCKGSVDSSAKKCQHCGEWLDGRKTAGEQVIGFGKLGVVVLGLLIVLAVYFMVRGGI